MERAWRFRLARCRVRIPSVPARLRDLGVFQRLEAAFDSLQADTDRQDHLLLATFQDLWLFLPLEEMCSLTRVLAPLLDNGFHVEAEVREAPLANLTDWTSHEGSPSMTYRYLQPDLPTQVAPPLCEVCQLAPGTIRWQRSQDDVPEQLCASCTNTRDQYSQRFERLEEWTDGYATWLRVGLDFTALDGHLRRLFEEYVSTVGAGVIDTETSRQFVTNLRTTALMVDYVNDFLAMQEDLAKQLRAVFSGSDVEELTSRRKELLVVRLENRSDVFRLLQLCHLAVLRHFPRSVGDPPFRVVMSVGPVRFPFGEYWRLLQQPHDEITVYLVGSGRLTCRFQAVPELLALAREPGSPRRGLHRLADLAGQSPALARVALADRAEREMAGIAPRLQQIGLDFEGMATFARLTKG